MDPEDLNDYSGSQGSRMRCPLRRSPVWLFEIQTASNLFCLSVLFAKFCSILLEGRLPVWRDSGPPKTEWQPPHFVTGKMAWFSQTVGFGGGQSCQTPSWLYQEWCLGTQVKCLVSSRLFIQNPKFVKSQISCCMWPQVFFKIAWQYSPWPWDVFPRIWEHRRLKVGPINVGGG